MTPSNKPFIKSTLFFFIPNYLFSLKISVQFNWHDYCVNILANKGKKKICSFSVEEIKSIIKQLLSQQNTFFPLLNRIQMMHCCFWYCKTKQSAVMLRLLLLEQWGNRIICCSSRLPSTIRPSLWQLVVEVEESQITAKAKVRTGLWVWPNSSYHSWISFLSLYLFQLGLWWINFELK